MTRLKDKVRQEEEEKIRWFDHLKSCRKRCTELEEQVLTLEKCDEILAALEVGKQSAQYKRVKAVLEQLTHQKDSESGI